MTVKGPPAYLTTDWEEAEKSVKLLRDLNAKMVIPSHGLPMEEELKQDLNMLAKHFEEVTVPEHERFVDN